VSLGVQLKGTQPLIIYDELGEEKQKLKRMRELDEGLQGTEYKKKQKLYAVSYHPPTRLTFHAYNHEFETYILQVS
jgi:hypothetical protein